MSFSRKFKPPTLPTRQGVSPSCVVLPDGPWTCVLDFLVHRFTRVSEVAWQQRLARGEVFDAHGQALSPQSAYTPGARVYYYRQLPDEPTWQLSETVLFQDDHLLVVDKPHFMPVIPTGRYVQRSLLVRLKQRLGLHSLSPIHRIDRETAGLVLFSLRPEDRNAYHALFRDQQVHKAYEAVAPVRADLALPLIRRSALAADVQFFKSREVSGEPNSQTHIALLKQEGTHGLYALTPLTGQRHQLRVHMHALGLPIEGDQFYPQVLRGPEEEDDHSHTLQLLAKRIAFTDPITGQARSFVSQQRLRIAS